MGAYESIIAALRSGAEDLGEMAAGTPGSPYGEAMNSVMAAARSVRGGTYDEELENIRHAREQRYPGAYSAMREVSWPAMYQAQKEDMIAQGIGMAAPVAFHGSPHVFDKFSMEKIGTGEGAQAYGHGLYFTSKPQVAESYRSGLTARSADYAHGIDWQKARDTVMQRLRDYADQMEEVHLVKGKEWTTALNRSRRARDQAEFMAGMGADDLPAWQLRDIAHEYGVNADDLLSRPTGAFYQVDIPDNLLDYDRPLAEQPARVQENLKAAGVWPDVKAHDIPADPEWGSMGGASQQNAVEIGGRPVMWGEAGSDPLSSFTGRDLYDFLAMDSRPQLGGAGASQRLAKAGIPGHRYKGDTSGVENYVIYDDSQIKTLGRYPSIVEYLKATAEKNQ